MSKPTFRRFLAYIIDVLIIALVASALSRVKFLNPYLEKYDQVQQRVETLVEEAGSDANKLQEILDSEETITLSYQTARYGVFTSIYTVVLGFLYFVVFQYYTKGKTLGRLLSKIELVSSDGEDVSFVQLVKRSIIINSLVTSTILICMLLLLNQKTYLSFARFVQLIDYGLILVSCGFVIYREDGVGLHDLFAGTRVILSEERDMLKNNNIKEAKVVKETKTKEKKSE